MVDARAGHSVGEVAAAYAAGLYTLDEALAVALELGKAATLSGEGAMIGLLRASALLAAAHS